MPLTYDLVVIPLVDMTRKTQPKTRKPVNRLPTDDTKVFDVLRSTNGNVNQAARKLDVTGDTLHMWLSREEGRRAILDEIRNTFGDDLLDQADTALMRNLKSREGHTSNRAIETAYKYRGKRRGLVPASQVEHEGTEDIRIEVVRE